MRKLATVIMAICGSAGCNPAPNTGQKEASDAAPAPASAGGWTFEAQPDSAALLLTSTARQPVIRIACARPAQLAVNVPAFKPIGSEERLSFGAAGDSVALVADSRGDQARGGVSGEGPIPDEMKRLVIAPLSASYGAQTSGPHAPPPEAMAREFLSACSKFQEAARVEASKPKPGTSPCLVQDGELLNMPPMRALGTEPFWNARTEGRCVTYSTPENQQGTRIWTKVESGPMGPVWVGNYLGKPFVLRVQPKPGCSDGMSDNRYDWDAGLTVDGEERRGCAERT